MFSHKYGHHDCTDEVLKGPSTVCLYSLNYTFISYLIYFGIVTPTPILQFSSLEGKLTH